MIAKGIATLQDSPHASENNKQLHDMLRDAIKTQSSPYKLNSADMIGLERLRSEPIDYSESQH